MIETVTAPPFVMGEVVVVTEPSFKTVSVFCELLAET
jgi:hypothetical protein